MKWTKVKRVKPKRNDLISVTIVAIDGRNDRNGDIVIEVMNGSDHVMEAPIILESNLPLIFTSGKRIINEHGRLGTTARTGTITIPPCKTIETVIHWNDIDDELKFLRVQARFLTEKSEEIDL